MAEIGDAPSTGDPCRDVVEQLLRACQRDPDISYYVNPLSSTGEKMVKALVATRGLSESAAQEALWYKGTREPRIVMLEERASKLAARVEHLEELLDGCEPGWRERDEEEADRG